MVILVQGGRPDARSAAVVGIGSVHADADHHGLSAGKSRGGFPHVAGRVVD